MIVGLSGRFHQLVDDVLRGAQIRVPHTQIDNVLAFAPGLHFNGIDLGKDIRRQAVQSGKFAHCANLSYFNGY